MLSLTIKSIVETLIAEIDESSSLDNCLAVERTVQATYNKIQGMPKFLKTGIATLTLLFSFYGLFTKRRLFPAQTVPQRIHQIAEWRGSSISACRELIQFYEKLAAFVYFSQGDS